MLLAESVNRHPLRPVFVTHPLVCTGVRNVGEREAGLEACQL